MSLNPSITLLDDVQINKRTYDESNDAVRMSLVSGVETSIELSHSDGDSVVAYPGYFLQEQNYTSASSDPLAAADAKGFRAMNLHLKVLTQTNADVTFTLEFSPADSGDMWYSTALAVTVLSTDVANTLKSGTELSVLARRVRLNPSAAIASGNVQLNLIGA